MGGVTIWNNGNNQIEAPSADASSGMSIRINSDTSATLTAQYISPGRQLDSSQGSHQVLPNGNHFLGMGSHPYMYEQTPEGVPVWYARFGEFPIQSYRAYKWEWDSNPSEEEMGIFSYSRGCYGNAAHYVSWNGATDVAVWDFFSGASEDGEFAKVASLPYDGTFETVAVTPYNLYAYAVAYGHAGQRLGQTKTVRTWTPSPDFGANCTGMACPRGTDYMEAPQTECPAPVELPAYESDNVDYVYPTEPTTDATYELPSVEDVAAYEVIPRRPRKFIS